MIKNTFRSVLIGLVLLVAGTVLYYWNEVRISQVQTTALVEAAFNQHGRIVTVKEMSPQRIATLLRIEDPAFMRHRGVDLTTPGAGMTTIAQGLVKQIYFPERFTPGIAKIKQTLIAQHALDALVPKNVQLELYLNITYFGTVSGKPVHGLSDAARVYFAKPHQQLLDDEFLSLIGMTVSPDTLKPGSDASAKRVERIKRYLNGQMVPASVMDFDYLGTTRGTVAEEALMVLLRLITSGPAL
jgi:membrane peptidoglycan carboxypeptidase